jgi:hypothetical protein
MATTTRRRPPALLLLSRPAVTIAPVSAQRQQRRGSPTARATPADDSSTTPATPTATTTPETPTPLTTWEYGKMPTPGLEWWYIGAIFLPVAALIALPLMMNAGAPPPTLSLPAGAVPPSAF